MMELPHDTIALAGLAIIVVGGLLHLLYRQAAAERRAERRATQQLTILAETHEQVRNDHPQSPNLRHDVDEIREIVRDIQDRSISQERMIQVLGRDATGLRVDVSAVRFELHEERDRSIAADDRLLAELAAERVRSIEVDAELRGRIDQCPGAVHRPAIEE